MKKFQDAVNKCLEEFDKTPLGVFKNKLEEKQGLFNVDRDTLQQMYDLQIEIDQNKLLGLDKIKELDNQEEEYSDNRRKIWKKTLIDVENLKVNDLVRLEKFKRWAKKNLFVLSGVAIAVAGAIRAIVMVTRSALRKGSTAAKQAEKIINDATKRERPFGPIFNWIPKIASLGAKGWNWLSKNLRVLALAIAYIIFFL